MSERNDRREVWQIVFQKISDCQYVTARDLVKLLEQARDEDGYGPQYAPTLGLSGLTQDETIEVVRELDRQGAI